MLQHCKLFLGKPIFLDSRFEIFSSETQRRSCCEKHNELALIKLPSKIEGAVQPASTPPLDFAAVLVVVSLPSAHPSRWLEFPRVARNITCHRGLPCFLRWVEHDIIHACIRHRDDTRKSCVCRADETCHRSRPCDRPRRVPTTASPANRPTLPQGGRRSESTS